MDWGSIHDPLQTEAKVIIAEKVKLLRLKAKRKSSKKIAEARFLRRKRGKAVGKILKECPDIGNTTAENYVKSTGAGADSWRRTGLVTFRMEIVSFRKRPHSLESKNIYRTFTRESLDMGQWSNFAWPGIGDGNQLSAIKGLQK